MPLSSRLDGLVGLDGLFTLLVTKTAATITIIVIDVPIMTCFFNLIPHYLTTIVLKDPNIACEKSLEKAS